MILELQTNFELAIILNSQEDPDILMGRIAREAMHQLNDHVQKAAESPAGVALGEFYVFAHGTRQAEISFTEKLQEWGLTNFIVKFEWVGSNQVHLDVTSKEGTYFYTSKTVH